MAFRFLRGNAKSGAGKYQEWKLRVGGWMTAAIVVGLNLWLAQQTIADWANNSGTWAPLVWTVSLTVTGALIGLLVWITVQPYRRQAASRTATLGLEARTADLVAPPIYRRILVPVDHSPLDRLALSHAAALASKNHGRIFLLHVEEGVNSMLYGSESSTAEVEAGRSYLDSLVHSLSEMEIDVETSIRHGSNPTREIVRYANEIRPDLLVMGAHGHGGLKDLVFGNTINPVRHALNVPILVVRDI